MSISRVNGILVPLGSPDTATSLSGTSHETEGSAFEIQHVGKEPVIKFSLDAEVHIALWSKVSDDESWGDEWARVRAHVTECFQVSDSSAIEMSYIDEDRDEITLYSAHCWKSFISLVRRDLSKVQTVHITATQQTASQPEVVNDDSGPLISTPRESVEEAPPAYDMPAFTQVPVVPLNTFLNK